MSRFMMFHPPMTASMMTENLAATRPMITAGVPLQPPAVALNTVVVRPVTVQNSVHVAMMNPAISRFQIQWLHPFVIDAPRESFQFPPTLISPDAPTDQSLFEEPSNASSKHYLPAYLVAETDGVGGKVWWVSLAPAGPGFELTVHLADATPASLGAGNAAIDAAAAYTLQGNFSGMVKTWSFNKVTPDGATLKLILDLPTKADLDDVYAAMTRPEIQAKLTIRRSLTVASPVPQGDSAVPLFRSNTVAIDSSILFFFDKDLNKNIYAQVGEVGSVLNTWHIVRTTWNGREYAYYQDRSQPHQVYFLPDTFKISRQHAPPHSPSMIVSTNGQDVNALTLTLSFIAVGVWDPNRLADAAVKLQQSLSLDAPVTLTVPFNASPEALTLSLNLPSSDPGASPGLVPQPNATLSIMDGITASVTLKLPQFQQVYAALFDQISPLLSGQLKVIVGTDEEVIPVIARAADFAGDNFSFKTLIDVDSNQVLVTLQNAIESPIQIDDLQGVLLQGRTVISNAVEQVSPAVPLTLAPTQAGPPTVPGDSVSVAFKLPTGTVVDSSCSVSFDFSRAHVLPNQAALLQAIMQNQVVGPVSRPITINFLAAMLKPSSSGTAPAAGASPALLAVQVVFEDGQTATFDNTMTPDSGGWLAATVNLAVPLKQYVLQDAQTGTYRYRVDLITAAGTTRGDWVMNNQDKFFLTGG